MKRNLSEKQKEKGKKYIISAKEGLKLAYNNYLEFKKLNLMWCNSELEKLNKEIDWCKERLSELQRKYL